MIKLERNKMDKAIAKAKQLRPRVKMTAERTYTVSGSRGNSYTVYFVVARDAKGNPVKLGECTCPAGREEMVCYHLVAAAAVNVAVHTMRQQSEAAKAAPAQAPTDERATLIETVKAAWHRVRPFAAVGDALRQCFGVTTLDALPDESLNQIRAALTA